MTRVPVGWSLSVIAALALLVLLALRFLAPAGDLAGLTAARAVPVEGPGVPAGQTDEPATSTSAAGDTPTTVPTDPTPPPPTATETVTAPPGTGSATPSATATDLTATDAPSPTAEGTATAAATATVTASATGTATVTPSPTARPTVTPTSTLTTTPTATATARPSATATATATRRRGRGWGVYLPVTMLRKVALGRQNPFGVQLSEERFRDPEMIAEVRRAGATWWRTFLFWDEVEPTRTSPPTYDWRHYDPLFQTADRLGLTVIAEIQGNPSWAAPLPGGPPRDFDQLAQFLAAAVERYDGDGYRDAPGSPRVTYWELYNEPDNTDAELARQGRGWGIWGHHGAAYARMLRRVYPAIKAANPPAKVVFGGIAHDAFIPSGPFDPHFLDQVLAAGGGPYFDVMNFHYYPLFAPVWDPYGPGVAGKAAALSAKLAAYGVSTPMLVTEAGMWNAAQPPYPPASDEDQVRYVVKLYTHAVVGGVMAVCWFQFDDVAGFDDPARGLLDNRLVPKPAHSAFRIAADLLTGATAETPVRDPVAPGEVYWFRRGEDRLAAAWTNDGSTGTLVIRAPLVERVHVLGTRVIVRDGSDGRLDGLTEVRYGADPVYVLVPTGGR
jgi:hypothetical protein